MDGKKAFEASAEVYDLLYKDKNYNEEVEFIKQFFKEQKNSSPKVLELGCGTGNYLEILSKEGFEVTGVDISEEMLKIAGKKCNCKLIQSDLVDLKLNEKFDICLVMFDVLGYITKNEDLEKVLTKINQHLNEGGLLIFQVWNGSAVLFHHPEEGTREAEDDDLKVIRYKHPVLKAFEETVDVHFKYKVLDKKTNVSQEFEETHPMRYFFPQEIDFLLQTNDFEPIKISEFMNSNKKPDESTWELFVVAKKK